MLLIFDEKKREGEEEREPGGALAEHSGVAVKKGNIYMKTGKKKHLSLFGRKKGG